MNEIRLEELESLWKTEFFTATKERARNFDFRYEFLSERDQAEILSKTLAVLSSDLTESGSHRVASWEQGWGENLLEFSKSGALGNLIPKYFGKYQISRYRQQWIRPHDPMLEYNLLCLLTDWLACKYFASVGSIFEFGAGTGHNLLRLRQIFPEANLMGLDWATSSQKCITKLAFDTNDDKLLGRKFNFFEPDYNLDLGRGDGVVTIAALEQVGDSYQFFLDFLMLKNVKIVLHIEPIIEVLESDNLLDNLSIQYMEKRRYLNGMLKYLQELESAGLIEIFQVQRSWVGSLFLDGYTIIAWRPI
ncbi:unannotated protein [freshwater metagenome]|uniref:Unannotated protein n=1 Tax=freshwater metagenome TaxID=449393 RepID=A0A6J7LM02_9ZZZZ|nr:hypothetical protein [Actinomycetota bacterium]MSW25678.1 hypothetical protein [Actinomycetota bacterium]MSW33410.1 hypothetical protein [Actinomycetota bacterium]MSX30434.1 hypothetical protein [Actinomycetota bacterium]MSX51334.1 hypothetical protein [Actinomycetota bacterium]